MSHFMLAPLLEMGYQTLLMELLVAIPCLNEDKTIRNVIEQIHRDIPKIDGVTVLVVDDWSSKSDQDL
jgi:hypothetical protein